MLTSGHLRLWLVYQWLRGPVSNESIAVIFCHPQKGTVGKVGPLRLFREGNETMAGPAIVV